MSDYEGGEKMTAPNEESRRSANVQLLIVLRSQEDSNTQDISPQAAAPESQLHS